MSGGGGCGYDGKIAGLYDLEETLGRGHYAVVKLARHVFTGEKVAVKVKFWDHNQCFFYFLCRMCAKFY